ncbi:hypothetical protein THASP1DRAFT_24123 [Thamnocephalis sphaerospora]|uniref:Survival Motor Neuron Gemin2-binding domain-containing protein n=1 Tax=Thamnocephalis sphaerospora TaxID=78915 RepID=A0A4P9XQJ9_9FUNG|nr:hypothetical protein THASP1DRAFT_24123 [Thamnocephalis sphaerospora]|eukprot:RKP07771.1 hypothetical protein THASP1DRAFT_24123 [Thamnocephalis sphaerospora]
MTETTPNRKNTRSARGRGSARGGRAARRTSARREVTLPEAEETEAQEEQPQEAVDDGDVWDDSALIEAWDNAAREYQMHHSEAALATARRKKKSKLAHDRSAASEAACETGKASQEHAMETDAATDAAYGQAAAAPAEGDWYGNQAYGAYDSAAASSTPYGPFNPALPQDEDMANMMMAWYYAGYYTAIYQSKQPQGQPAAVPTPAEPPAAASSEQEQEQKQKAQRE